LLFQFGFFLLVYCASKYRVLTGILRRTRTSLEESTRQRLLEKRSNLAKLETEKNLWIRLERQLDYSGIRKIIPFINGELLIIGTVLLAALSFLCALSFCSVWVAACIAFSVPISVYAVLLIMRFLQRKQVEAQLLKFLDFMGNYSITGGEVSSIFLQISRYMEEPLRSVLEECYYEAQVTGDLSMALLSMAAKIEHPQFQEIIRNLEISYRYSADCKILVNQSRRSVREYLRNQREQKSMLREAAINMSLLMAMSVFAVVCVGKLVDVSVTVILFGSVPGKLSVGLVAFLFFLFGKKIIRLSA